MKWSSRLPGTLAIILGLLAVGIPLSEAQAASPASSLLAYIGPGAGLGFLGSLFAVLMVLFLGLVGLVLYPLKLAIRWLRRNRATSNGAPGLGPGSIIGSKRT